MTKKETDKHTNRDVLQRFIFDKAPVRGEYIHLDKSFKSVIDKHPYPEPIRKLLGEALCAAGLLSAIIKFKGRLTLQFNGKGKLKLLLAQCDNDLNLRGLVKWDEEMSYEDLMDAFNQGVLGIMLDSGPNNRYQGIVTWRGNSLSESIEGYFQDSEQLATKIWLNTNKHSASGYLLQIIPNDEKGTEKIDDEMIHTRWDNIIESTQLNSNEIFTQNYEDLLKNLYPDEEIRIFPSYPVQFKCSCSRERGENAILILGREEAEAELKNNKNIVVTCDFCNQEYVFDKTDVVKIFENKDKTPTQLH